VQLIVDIRHGAHGISAPARVILDIRLIFTSIFCPDPTQGMARTYLL
jgi:hypothetical protein